MNQPDTKTTPGACSAWSPGGPPPPCIIIGACRTRPPWTGRSHELSHIAKVFVGWRLGSRASPPWAHAPAAEAASGICDMDGVWVASCGGTPAPRRSQVGRRRPQPGADAEDEGVAAARRDAGIGACAVRRQP